MSWGNDWNNPANDPLHVHQWCICFGSCSCNRASCWCGVDRPMTDEEIAEKSSDAGGVNT